ncbi:hypothetical protein RFI_22415 [Reticulomyxa filosa]|uniref:Ras-GEF domain-containing protein n=1 Tax=Reticulomyxa filosa TaxID=46433 RepID=X6MLS4_RETFI|nr:hypothetical protein RFI_22415 [Reticulomyxa filosa]|eukprot:ETO14953.1 hypothetical protein RFI_22415 [Reticulomyxa filosa]
MRVLHQRFCECVSNDSHATWRNQLAVAQLVCLWTTQYWKEDFEHARLVCEELDHLKKNVRACIKDTLKCQQIEKLLSLPVTKTSESSLSSSLLSLSFEHPSFANKQSQLQQQQQQHDDDGDDDITSEDDIRGRWPYLAQVTCSKHTDTLDITRYKPHVLAEQLTLMDHFVFVGIQPRELISQGWTNFHKWKRSPQVLQMIGQFNSISHWCQFTILTASTNNARKKLLKHFIAIAMRLNELHNYSSLCSVHAAITSTPIQRCKEAWQSLRKNKKYMTLLENISSIFSWKTSILKKLHMDAKGTVVPHLGTILHTLATFKEGNNYLEDGSVNKWKMIHLAEFIEKLTRWQKVF